MMSRTGQAGGPSISVEMHLDCREPSVAECRTWRIRVVRIRLELAWCWAWALADMYHSSMGTKGGGIRNPFDTSFRHLLYIKALRAFQHHSDPMK
jgi:hypothetical protein